ncbi:MAG: hypothetical protein ACI9R3_001427 [Verrucomicrobiales bacterium]|jgi:hypothetical protein
MRWTAAFSLRPSHQANALDPTAIASAFRRDGGIILKSIVNQPTFIGIHGLQADRLSANSNALSQVANFFQHSILPHGAVVFDIDANTWRFWITHMHEAIHQILQVFQSLPATTDEQIRFFGEHLQPSIGVTLILFHPSDEAKVSQHGIKNLLSLLESGYAHPQKLP